MKRVSERADGSRRVEHLCEGESLTEQAHGATADINAIMRRAERTGEVPVRDATPVYGDFTAVGDYHSALEAVRNAQTAFMSLAPEIRERFGNDPGRLLMFLSDESNRPEAEKLGLVETGEPRLPAVGEVVPA